MTRGSPKRLSIFFIGISVAILCLGGVLLVVLGPDYEVPGRGRVGVWVACTAVVAVALAVAGVIRLTRGDKQVASSPPRLQGSMQRMNRDQTKTFLVVTGALFVASGALVAYQVLSGNADPGDSFSRVFVTGAAALFTSAALAMLLRRSRWRPWQKAVAVGVNFAATLIACWLIVRAIWP